jgi:hypothetical protein
MSEYKEFSAVNDEIRVFMGMKEFNRLNVHDFKSLMKEYNRTKDFIRQMLANINKLSLKKFITVFLPINEEILARLCKESEMNAENAEKILDYQRAFNMSYLDSLSETIHALVMLKQQTRPDSVSSEDTRLTEGIAATIAEVKAEEDPQTPIADHYKTVRHTEKYVAKILPAWETDTRAKILRATYRCWELFKEMDKAQLSKDMLTHLKEYSNEQQNSIAKVDIVMEFRNVFQFWE